jgi:hypothetical protein
METRAVKAAIGILESILGVLSVFMVAEASYDAGQTAFKGIVQR